MELDHLIRVALVSHQLAQHTSQVQVGDLKRRADIVNLPFNTLMENQTDSVRDIGGVDVTTGMAAVSVDTAFAIGVQQRDELGNHLFGVLLHGNEHPFGIKEDSHEGHRHYWSG